MKIIYYSFQKNRHEIRRKIRKFENNLEFEIIETDESNVDEHLLEFLRLMKLNPEKRNFLNQSRIEFMSKIIKYAILSNIGNLTFIKIEMKWLLHLLNLKITINYLSIILDITITTQNILLDC